MAGRQGGAANDILGRQEASTSAAGLDRHAGANTETRRDVVPGNKRPFVAARLVVFSSLLIPHPDRPTTRAYRSCGTVTSIEDTTVSPAMTGRLLVAYCNASNF